MVVNPIKMDQVFRRELCMSDSRELTEAGTLHFNLLYNAIDKNHNQREIRSHLFNFLRECSSKVGAKQYHKDCMNIFKLLKECHNPLYEEAFTHFLNYVLPYYENTQDAIYGEWNDSHLAIIKEAAEQYRICDRILSNHAKLSKRFKIDSIAPSKYTTIDELCRSICEMVDTYDIKPHIKMELVFEEVSYLADKKCMTFNQQDMVESVCDYFLSIPRNSVDDISILYAKAITESPMLNIDADKKVKYITENMSPGFKNNLDDSLSETVLKLMIMESESSGDDKVKELMNKYKLETEKSDSKFKQVLNKIFTQSPQAIVEDTPDILKWVRNFAVLAVAAQSPIAAIVMFLVNGYVHFDLRKKEAERVIKYFENERNHVEERIDRSSNPDTISRLEDYANALDKAIYKLNEYNNSLYTSDELTNKADDDISFDEMYTIQEAKETVIMNNLIDDAQKADKIIETLGKKSLEKIGAKKTGIKDKLTKESVFKYIDSDSRISMVLCSYDTTDCKNISELNENADSIIKGINNVLYHTNAKVYYTMYENCIDFELRSKFKMLTTLTEDATIENSMTDVEIIRATTIVEAADYMEKLLELSPNTIVDKAIKRIGLISKEQASMFIEAWGMGVPIDREDVGKFVDEYVKYQNECGEYIDAYEINKLYQSIVYEENASLEDVVESTQIMVDIITEGVDLNSLKLAWMGFKKKMKGMSAKEKEACRDLDMAFNNLVKGVKSFYQVTDNRERIIKGQVCPSLSRIIKIGISLAALGVVSGGITLPAIAAVTGLALSKNASDKERKLILDEIDIELQVVERELRRVDDNDKSSKKYRTLLAYQKNLQREKQRIVYNLSRKGKAIPVKSTAGLGGGKD